MIELSCIRPLNNFVTISLQAARYCMAYPVLAYNVTLTSDSSHDEGHVVEVSISGNQTEVVIGKEYGLRHNKKYVITVTAINMVGSVTSHGNGRNTMGECVHT